MTSLQDQSHQKAHQHPPPTYASGTAEYGTRCVTNLPPDKMPRSRRATAEAENVKNQFIYGFADIIKNVNRQIGTALIDFLEYPLFAKAESPAGAIVSFSGLCTHTG